MKRIFKAGTIATEEEYYLLKALQDAPVAESTTVAIEKLLGDYELRSASRP